jgi:hypothetical protein
MEALRASLEKKAPPVQGRAAEERKPPKRAQQAESQKRVAKK